MKLLKWLMAAQYCYWEGMLEVRPVMSSNRLIAINRDVDVNFKQAGRHWDINN